MDTNAQPQQAQEPEAFSQFPAPPGFYALYEAGPDAGPPPPQPIRGQIHALGEFFDTDAPFVPPLDVPQQYTVRPDYTVDIKAELVKFNKSLLFLFLELLSVLVQHPSAYSSALSPVLVTQHNMMHLINLARHHQARETLKLALQSQIQQKQAALDQLRSQAQDMRSKLLAITQKLAAVGGDVAESLPRQQQSSAAAAAMEEG